ncbi:MAG TPA: GNAT family N-acetyltransferase [Candidatus Krumholzibacterium sp.]|nr:GNAT family N-acetyltransferase [Candidatus Krumholzibacterium sp.]
MEWHRDDYLVTDDAGSIDFGFVERMLRTTYWASARSRREMERAAGNSINFSLLHGGTQIGYARVVTDGTLFAWIADVIVDPAHRRKGLGVWLVECVLEHPDITDTVQQLLRTRDAHGLYSPFGFETAECMTRRKEGY